MRSLSLRWIATILICASAEGAASRPGWLGFGFTVHQRGRETWLYVRAVEPGGPAEKAGLMAQDVITSIDGRALSFRNDVEAVKFFHKILAGQKVRLNVTQRQQRRTMVIAAVPLPRHLEAQRKRSLELATARTSRKR